VRVRIERAAKISAADYVDMSRARAALVRAMDAQLADLDALVLPTTAIAAPRLSDIATPETFGPANVLLLRNPSLVNFFDLCAISLPIPGGGLPVGLMLVARNGQDRRLFRMAAGLERVLQAA
jgi:aspartyl-tRNA(Asn)/glutamyl-tRNA(Gln) amidotransferase subunit A